MKEFKRFPEKYFRGYCGLTFIDQIALSRNLKQERFFPPNIQNYPNKRKFIPSNVP